MALGGLVDDVAGCRERVGGRLLGGARERPDPERGLGRRHERVPRRCVIGREDVPDERLRELHPRFAQPAKVGQRFAAVQDTGRLPKGVDDGRDGGRVLRGDLERRDLLRRRQQCEHPVELVDERVEGRLRDGRARRPMRRGEEASP